MESEEEEDDDADDANGVIASSSNSHGGGAGGGDGGSGASGADGVSTRKLAAQTMQMKEQLSGLQAQMSELRHDVRGKMAAIEASNASMHQEMGAKLDALLAAVATGPPRRSP